MTSSTKPRKYAKVTISLPAELQHAVDQRQQERGESRSEVVRHAIEELFRREHEQAAEEQWIRSYREQPQTEEEIGWAAVSLKALAELPWDVDETDEVDQTDEATKAKLTKV